MSWRYAPLSSGIWDSAKFLALPSDAERLSYVYLVNNRHGNGLGCYRLPDIYLAADRRIDPFESAKHLEAIEKVGLIERGPDDMIRIIGWFYQDTGANNPSSVSNFCKLFLDTRRVKRNHLRSNALAEMIWATLPKAENWNPNTQPFERMQQDLNRMLRAEARSDPKGMAEAFQKMPPVEPDTLLHTFLDTLSHTVSYTLYHTVGDIEQEEVEGPVGGEGPGGGLGGGLGGGGDRARTREEPFHADQPPASPAKGSRSAGRKPDKDTQAAIDELTRKAAGKKA